MQKTDKRREKKKIDEALMKVALGYSVEEVTEEYAEVDGELRLTKRKETKKDIPPDLKAVQMLLSSAEDKVSALSDEELEEEKKRLLKLLQGEKKTEKDKDKDKVKETGKAKRAEEKANGI